MNQIFKIHDIGLRNTLQLILRQELSDLKKIVAELRFCIIIMRPVEIVRNLTSETYLENLLTKVEDVARENQQIWLQQGGVLAHFGLETFEMIRL